MSDITISGTMEAPETPETPETGILAAPPVPLWRRPRAWITAVVAALAAAGLAAGLMLTVFAGGPSGPSAILARDGYSLIQTVSHDGVIKLAGNSQDGKMAASVIDSAVLGAKGSKAEAVLELTDFGKALVDNPALSGTLLGSLRSSMGSGATVHVVDGGRYLAIDAPASQMNGSNWITG